MFERSFWQKRTHWVEIQICIQSLNLQQTFGKANRPFNVLMIAVKFTPSMLSLYRTCLCKQHIAVPVMTAFKYMLRYLDRNPVLDCRQKAGQTYKKRHWLMSKGTVPMWGTHPILPYWGYKWKCITFRSNSAKQENVTWVSTQHNMNDLKCFFYIKVKNKHNSQW